MCISIRNVGFRLVSAVALFLATALAQSNEVDFDAVAAALPAAYPDAIDWVGEGEIHWRDRTVSPLGDVRAREPLFAIPDDASVAEQFFYRYPMLAWGPTRSPTDDPGRLRNEAFFIKMYGDCRTRPRPALRSVRWLRNSGSGASLQIATANNLDRIVERLSDEIDALPMAFKTVAMRPGGGFACRTVAGRKSLSMHAFGAAIDLDPRVGCYWRWSGQLGSPQCASGIPLQLIELFEEYGFIWGGKWLHVDTMHFEYRPELIEYSKRISTDAKYTP